MPRDDQKTFRRRDVLRAGVAAGVGVGLAPLARAAEPDGPLVQGYRTLGRTGMRISDISYGSGGTRNALLPIFAFNQGVNYFDTADSYGANQGGRVETMLGKGLMQHAPRDKFYLTTKTIAMEDDDRETLMKRLEASLRRLRTDYVDIYLNHAVNKLSRVKNPEWPEFVEKAKRQGKVRFTGMSGHGGNLIECLDYGLDNDLFDVILVAYNFGQDPAFYSRFIKDFDVVAVNPELPSRIERAHAKGVGVIAMKTLMGARLNDMTTFQRKGGTAAHAAFRWTLSNPNVDALIVSMKKPEQVREYLAASGSTALREGDAALLREHLEGPGTEYCRHGCNACESSCPLGVEISEVLRTRMYATHYRDRELAAASYAKIAGDATPCLDCSVQTCADACSYGLEVARLTRTTPGVIRNR